MVHYTGADGFREAMVNITQGTVESDAATAGQPMVLFTEFIGALTGALENPEMIAGLAARGLTPDQAFCLPLTAGNFFTEEYEGTRLMRVPCYQAPDGSNFYAKPIEGLFAVYDLGTREVVRVVDQGAIPLPADPWGYTEDGGRRPRAAPPREQPRDAVAARRRRTSRSTAAISNGTSGG